jgi:hypothetical protein
MTDQKMAAMWQKKCDELRACRKKVNVLKKELAKVRVGTLDEVAQMMRSDAETDYDNWREYSAFWQSKLRDMMKKGGQ